MKIFCREDENGDILLIHGIKIIEVNKDTGVVKIIKKDGSISKIHLYDIDSIIDDSVLESKVKEAGEYVRNERIKNKKVNISRRKTN